MSPQTRRALRIDDPVAGEACHVAQARREQSGDGRLRDVGLEEVHANPSQPRKLFDDASLSALADSIRERGVLQPIIVQPRPGGGYELYLQYAIIRSGLIWGHFSSCCAPFAAVALRITDQTDGVISLLSPA